MSKERELLKEWVSSYIAREGLNDSYREPISLDDVYRKTMALFAQSDQEPVYVEETLRMLDLQEARIHQEHQFRVAEKCRELEIEIGQKEARMEVGMRSTNEPNPQGILQMAHMCSDAEYAAFRKRIGFDE